MSREWNPKGKFCVLLLLEVPDFEHVYICLTKQMPEQLFYCAVSKGLRNACHRTWTNSLMTYMRYIHPIHHIHHTHHIHPIHPIHHMHHMHLYYIKNARYITSSDWWDSSWYSDFLLASFLQQFWAKGRTKMLQRNGAGSLMNNIKNMSRIWLQ